MITKGLEIVFSSGIEPDPPNSTLGALTSLIEVRLLLD